MWDAIRSESINALSRPEVMARIDLPEIVKASKPLLAKDALSEVSAATNVDIEAQQYVALLLGRSGALQSGSGPNYRSTPDEIILKPLLILANNWIAMSENLKAKGADAWAPNYSGGVKVLDGSPLSDEAKAMVAKDAKMRELVPLNVRLNVVTHHLGDLSKTVKSTVERLKAAGKTTFVTEAIATSGITQARLDQLLK